MKDDKPPVSPPLLLKVPDACRVMGISTSTLYRLMAEGEIRGIHIGPRQRRIPVSEISDYITRKLAAEAASGKQGAA